VELLDAVVDRIVETATATMAPVVFDPELSAVAKLDGIFSTLIQWKGARKELMLELVRVWFSDANVAVREQLRRATGARLTPLLAEIVRQGKDEGVFTATSPDQTAGVLVATMLGANETASRLFLARQAGEVTFEEVERTLEAYAEAYERILGLPAGTWPVYSQTLHEWFD
jgi:hypothetical protein